jgi:hypothetical protein
MILKADLTNSMIKNYLYIFMKEKHYLNRKRIISYNIKRLLARDNI